MPTLEITTMIGCPVMCTFCPQVPLKNAYGQIDKYLNLLNFKQILSKIPKYVRIDFSGMSEPWANPDCTNMLEFTLEQGYQVAIYSTLYGMSVEDSIRTISLIENNIEKINIICIHLQDMNENMVGLKFTAEWVAVLNNFLNLYNKRIVKSFQMMTMDSLGKLHPFLNSLSSLVPPFNAIDRAGSLSSEQIPNNQSVIKFVSEKRLVCKSTPYYDHNVLLPNGDVLLCCMDYECQHVLGNLLSQDYFDIFNGSGLHEVRVANMQPNVDKPSICHSCGNVTILE